MMETNQKIPLDTRNISSDALEVFEFYAHCILDEENYEDRVRMIVKLQIEIQTLRDQFKTPISLFMKDHKRLIQHEFDKALYTRTEDYKAKPECMVKDLLNLVYCLAGYGAFYTCSSKCT